LLPPVAREQKYTRTIEDAGNSAEFGETLSFNLDCQPTDLVHIKAKHDSNFVDTTIGQLTLSSSAPLSGRDIQSARHRRSTVPCQHLLIYWLCDCLCV